MKPVKTSELQGAALDWAVAKCADLPYPVVYDEDGREVKVSPSTDWAQGGPIIERERIALSYDNLDGTGPCKAYYLSTLFDEEEGWHQYGPTPLIAAMRCFVASHLGDEVTIPAESDQ